MSRTTVIEGQDALFAAATAPTPTAAPTKPRKRTPPPRKRMNHALPLGNPWRESDPCDPRCITCGRPEGAGLCPTRCAVVCGRPEPLDPKGQAPVEVCLVTVHVRARLIVGVPGSQPGRKLAAVDCPRCQRVHWHAAAYGRRYRIAPCNRQPYIVHLQRPPTAAAAVDEHTEQHQHAAARGAAAARAALPRKATP